jgi:hypothetical protein
MHAVELHTPFDPRTLRPGLYSASSVSPAYAQLHALCVLGSARVVAQRHLRGGGKSIVCELRAPKRNDGAGQITLDPDFFQGALKDYHQWEVKWWRESIQNAVDAGAKSVHCSVRKLPDGTVQVRCDDDGRGMDRDTLVSKFLRLGASGKKSDAGAAGGFGKAKEMLLLPWLQWSVTTRTTHVVGAGLQYETTAVSERKGTRLEVVMPADNCTRIQLAMAFVERCNLPHVRFYFHGDGTELAGTKAEQKPGKLIREIPGKAKLYFLKGAESELSIRTGGLWMFNRYLPDAVKGRVTAELIGRSIDLLTANRDSFRDYDLSRGIEALAAEIAADTKSATKERDKSRKVYRGTGKFTPRAAKELEANLALASAGAMELASKISTGSGASVQLDAQTVTRMGDALLHDGGAGEAVVTDGELRVGGSPAASAVVVLSVTPVLGQEHLERIMKQLAWSPDFYVVNNHDGWKPPAGLLPERMNRKALALAKAWTELCRYVLIMLNSSAEFGVGWMFDDETGASYLREQGQHWLMLNPSADKADRAKVFDPQLPAHLNWLVACAVHEATHMANGIDLHNEAFSSALTANMATCAGIWAIAPLLVQAIFGGADVQQARALAVGLGGKGKAAAPRKDRVVERIVEKPVFVDRVVERIVEVEKPASLWDTGIASSGASRELRLTAPERARGRVQPQLGLKFNGASEPDADGVWAASSLVPGARVAGLGRIVSVLMADDHAAVCLVRRDDTGRMVRAMVRVKPNGASQLDRDAASYLAWHARTLTPGTAEHQRHQHILSSQPEWEELEGQPILRVHGQPIAAIPSTGRKNAAHFTVFDIATRQELTYLKRSEVIGWLASRAVARDAKPNGRSYDFKPGDPVEVYAGSGDGWRAVDVVRAVVPEHPGMMEVRGLGGWDNPRGQYLVTRSWCRPRKRSTKRNGGYDPMSNGDRPGLGGTWARVDHTAHVKALYEEAHRADPYHMDQVTERVTGQQAFVWDNLTLDQARAIGRASYTIVLMARG